MKLFISLLFSVTSCFSALAQWESMEGPYGGYINDLKNNDQFQFAATTHGLYRSADRGDTWHHLEISEGIAFACLQLAVHNDTLITDVVTLENGVINRYLFRSEDNGNTWAKLNRPEVPDFYLSIAFNKTLIYLTDQEYLWVSSDRGQSWNYSTINEVIQYASSLQSFGDQIYLSTYDKLYTSSGLNDQFEEIKLDSTFSGISNFYVFENLILAQGSSGKLYRSDNGGQSWTSQNINLNEWTNFVKIHDAYFVNTQSTILRSNDQGIHWTSVHTKNLPAFITFMTVAGERLLTGSWFYGIDASDDSGISFHTSNFGISATHVQSLLVRNNSLISGADYFGITACDLKTGAWDTSFLLKTPQKSITDIVAFNNSLYSIVDYRQIFNTDHNGLNWQMTLEDTDDDLNKFYFIDQTIGETPNKSILAGGEVPNGLLINKNGNHPWVPYKIITDSTSIWPYLFVQKENIMFAVKPRIIYRSFDKGDTWQPTPSELDFADNWSYIYALYTFKDMILAIEAQGSHSARLHVSMDNGDTWQISSDGLPADSSKRGIISLAFYNNMILAHMEDETQGVYVSFDNALSWKPFNEGLTLRGVQGITHDQEYLYAGTYGQGVWRRKISDLYTTSKHQSVVNNEISIYPNPSNGNFTINFNKEITGNANVVISDVNGRIYQKTNIELKPETEINTENLVPGFYLITLQTRDRIYTSRIIIQK